MKRIILVAVLAGVAACSKPAPTPEAAAESTTEAAPAAAAEPVAADGKSSVGTFKVTTDKGVFMEEDKADGTYVSTKDGKVTETGKWVQKSPSEFCYTKDEKDAKEVCNTEQVDAKGAWTSKNPEGKVATIERVAA